MRSKRFRKGRLVFIFDNAYFERIMRGSLPALTFALAGMLAGCSSSTITRSATAPGQAEPDAARPSTNSGASGESTTQRLRDDEGAPLSPSPRPATVTIASTGDLLLTREVIDVWHGMGREGLDRMLSGYASLIHDDEIATLNLETPLVDDVNQTLPGSPPLPPVLGAPPDAVFALQRAGVDLVSLANNHVFDQGFAGLQRTLELLENTGIEHAGVGPSREDSFRSTVVRQGGARVAFLSMTGLVNGRSERRGDRRLYVAVLFDEARVLEAIRAARLDADLVVVCVHWSTDFVPEPTEGQRLLARRMVEAGADLILGTGPHVLQEVERLPSARGEAVVAYSLGNLLSAMAMRYQSGQPVNMRSEPSRVRPEGRDGVVLRVRLEVATPSPGRPAAAPDQTLHIAALEAIPLWTHNTSLDHENHGTPLEIRVVPLNQAPAEIEAERRPRIAEALGDAVELLR